MSSGPGNRFSAMLSSPELAPDVKSKPTEKETEICRLHSLKALTDRSTGRPG